MHTLTFQNKKFVYSSALGGVGGVFRDGFKPVAALVWVSAERVNLDGEYEVGRSVSNRTCGCSLGAKSAAMAQTPFDSSINIQLFEYAIGPKSFLTVVDADVAPKRQFGADVLVTYLTTPFTVQNVDENTNEIIGVRTEVVESMIAAELSASYGLMNNLQVGISFPVILSMSGEGIDPATAAPASEGLKNTGLGDARLEAKYRFWHRKSLRMAAGLGLTVPTSVGSSSDFLGDDLPSARTFLAAQWTQHGGKLSLGANVGLLFRKPRTLFSSTVGQQLLYGGAAGFKISRRFAVIGEVFGRTGLGSFKLAQSPLEVNGGVRIALTESINTLVGAGAGVVRGIGSPGFRLFAAVGWSPDHRDDDLDGVPNHRDKCPSSPEDRDQFEDGDGCPDPDNDGDKRYDEEDDCPLKREDLDGFEDEDGCPDVDNDADGVPDSQDRCPMEPEDGLPPNKKDGCPAGKADTDGDGVPDTDDRCPNQPEDPDEFNDDDGCPELDNDRDGIPDEEDNCSNCSEDRDGFEDEDGCPEPESASIRMDGDKLIVDEVVQFSRSRIVVGPSGTHIVDSIAELMKKQGDVTQWLLVVAAKPVASSSRTRVLSRKQAHAIKSHLVVHGIPEAAIEAKGAVSDRFKIALRVRERGPFAEEEGEFVCPERFRAKSSGVAAEGGVATKSVAAPEADKAILHRFERYRGISTSVVFKRNSDTLRRGKKTLDALAALLIENPTVLLEVTTHTDSRRSVEQSLRITQNQAKVVRDYLLKQGVPEQQVQSTGLGRDRPIARNSSSRGRAKNRRVEFRFSLR